MKSKSFWVWSAGLLLCGCLLSCQSSKKDNAASSAVEPEKTEQSTEKVEIPTNYEESEVGDYHIGLPDPLVFNNGKPVKNERQWYKKRRPEIVRLFEENEYGKWPEKPQLDYDLTEAYSDSLDAICKQVTLYFTEDRQNGPSLDVLIYLPKDAQGPSPLLLNLSFSANNQVVCDPLVKPGKMWNRETGELIPVRSFLHFSAFSMNKTVKKFLEAGYGFATMHYTDVEPDFATEDFGLRAVYRQLGITQGDPDEWGAISCWAWCISNVMDYFEQDPSIDSKRIALTGCSRLGKTTVWAGAREPRIAVVMPSCSGEGGAAMSRRIWGETVAHLNRNFPYQFAENYQKWSFDVQNMPVDAHMLVALIAPRPLLLQTGSLDKWSDPKGEFISGIEGGKVYRFLGKDDFGTEEMPGSGQPIYHTLGYYMHEGKHGVYPEDWDIYLEFMNRYL